MYNKNVSAQLKNQRGYITFILGFIVLIVSLVFLYKPAKDYSSLSSSFGGSGTGGVNGSDQFCKPLRLTQDGKRIKPEYQSVYVTAHEYGDPGDTTIDSDIPIIPKGISPFGLIKENVPMLVAITKTDGTSELRFDTKHFKPLSPPEIVTPQGKSGTYEVYYPAHETSEGFANSNGEDQGSDQLFYYKYQIIFLLKLNPDGSLATQQFAYRKNPSDRPNTETFYIADIYQKVTNVPDYREIGAESLPSRVFNCLDFDPAKGPRDDLVFLLPPPSAQSVATPTANFTQPVQSSYKPTQLQLDTFVPSTPSGPTIYPKVFSSEHWYIPSCKPAIYLYPEQPTLVNVKVNTKGFLTYTDPLYSPPSGWTITAYPGGLLTTNQLQVTSYPYLYYESKVPDNLVEKPTQGYIVKKEELPELFNNILPKLGLNSKESAEFKDYWKKALHDSPYYFLGVMSENSINKIEPLAVSPTPQTQIRVRTYFQALTELEALSLGGGRGGRGGGRPAGAGGGGGGRRGGGRGRRTRERRRVEIE